MVKVVKKPRFSIWRYEQIYECEVPRRCSNPLELAVLYFKHRGIGDLILEDHSLRFSRGSNWASFFLWSELKKKQDVLIQLDESRRKLICQYSVFSPYPDAHIPPWRLHREIEQLNLWIEQHVSRNSSARAFDVEETHPMPRKTRRRFLALPASNFIFRLLYRCYRIISWMRYWETRRFTHAGQTLLVGACVAAMLGFDPENTVGYQGFALLLGMLLAAVLFRMGFKPSFSAERLLPRFGTVGQPFTYRVALRNLTGKNQIGITLLENIADPRPTFEQWKEIQLDDQKYVRPFRFSQRRRGNPFRLAKLKEAPIPALLSQQTGEVRVELTPLRRGIVRFNGVTLARRDPLGLFRALHEIRLPSSVLILPRRYPLPPIALPGALKYQQGGVAMASNVGQSDEFVALREYRRGDPLRHIHWRTWAKAGRPIVKEFEDEFFVRHALILDTFTDRPYSDEFEEAVSVAASFACTVVTQESLLDLLLVERQAYCFTAGRGLAHADQMLEILASVKPSKESFASLDELVVNHARLVSGCIFVLLAWDQPRQRLVQKMKILGLPVMALVIRPPGKSEALEPGPMRDDPERLVALEVGKVEEQLAELK